MRRHPPTPLKVGRPGITDLPLPSRRFNLTLTPGFETVEAVTEEDSRRARMLRRWAKAAGRKEAGALLALADAVDPDVTRYPTTSASARYMRAARIRIIGNLWELFDER